MSVLTTRYAIVDKNFTKYAYIDLGEVKYDEKMPRRSGTANSRAEAKKLLERFYTTAEKWAKYCERASKEWSYPKDKREWLQLANKSRSHKFNIVKMSVKEVK